MTFSPDDSRILISGFQGAEVKILDVMGNKNPVKVSGNSPAAFSPDGKTIITSANSDMFYFVLDDLVPKIWDAQSGKLLHRLEGHTKSISSAYFTSDGKKILTDSWPTTAKLWDIRNCKLLYSFERDSLNTKAFEFSSDGKYILTASAKSLVQIWDAANGKLVFSVVVDTLVGKPNTFATFFVKFSSDSKTIVTSSNYSQSVKVWDIEKKRLKFDFYSPRPVKLAAFNKDGTLLGIASNDGAARVWNLSDGSLKYVLRAFNTSISVNKVTIKPSPAKISPDGKIIITFPFEGMTEVWDAATGKQLYALYGNNVPEDPFSRDSKSFLTVVADDSSLNVSSINKQFVTIIRDINTGMPVHIFKGGETFSRQFSSDDKKIVTLSDDSRINIWDVSTGKLIWNIPAEFGDKIFFSLSDSKIITQNWGGSDIWDLQTGKKVKSIKRDNFVNSFMDDPYKTDSRFYLTINSTGDAVIWDLQSAVPVQTLKWGLSTSQSDMMSVKSYNFSPDGSTLLTDFGDGTTKLWDCLSGKVFKELKQQVDYGGTEIKAIGCRFTGPFSPDSKKIFGDCEGHTMIWDIQNQLWLPLPENEEYSSGAQITPDNKRVITISDSTVKFWDIQSGKFISSLEGQVESSFPLGYSLDGIKFAGTYANGSTSLWNSENGRLLYRFDINLPSSGESSIIPVFSNNDDQQGFRSFVFSPDGKYIVTTSENYLKIWDANTGKLSSQFNTSIYVQNPNISSSPFSPDNKTITVDLTQIPNHVLEKDSLAKPQVKTSIVDLSTGGLINSMEGYTFHQDLRSKTAFNSQGDRILTKTQDQKKFKLWDYPSGKLIYNLGWDDQERTAGSAVFSTDGKNILTSSYVADDNDYIIKYEPLDLWSVETGKVLHTINIGSALPQDIYWKDEVVSSIQNSKVGMFDIKTGKEKASFVAIDDNDYVFVLPSGEYMGTSGGVKYLSWRLNNKLYDFDQWDLQYNRPDKVLEQLGNPDTALIHMFRKAYLKRLKRAGFTEAMFSKEWHTPEIKILNPEEFAAPVSDPHKQLEISLSDTKFNLDRVNVWINDVPIAGQNGISLRNNPASSVIKDIPLTLSAGTNRIQVSCTNEKGVESLKEVVEVICNPISETKPDLYIIAISVSSYKDKRYNLQYAVKDGRDIASLFNSELSEKSGFNRIIIDTLFNAAAVKESFFKLREKLMATDVNDQVVVFVSGHGILDKNMDFYFATYDIDFSQPEKRGISFDNLEDLLDGIPARKKLMMMDACHSGEVDKEEQTDLIAQNVDRSSDITFRGDVKEYSFKGINSSASGSGTNLNSSFELMQELFAGLDKGTGTTVISAAAGKGYALESPKWNNGIFTYSIINGLKNKAADKNKDGIITISELKDYSIKLVDLLTGGKQKPTARRESINYDWKIW
jgi:WD40 repeat protein